MTYDFSVHLPASTIESLFADCEDDHAATPSAAHSHTARFAIANTKGHNDILDAFVQSKTPAARIRLYNNHMAMHGYRACAAMDAARRNSRLKA